MTDKNFDLEKLAELYPDAPYYWMLNKNNEIEKIGTTNIKKYSLNFELSK